MVFVIAFKLIKLLDIIQVKADETKISHMEQNSQTAGLTEYSFTISTIQVNCNFKFYKLNI